MEEIQQSNGKFIQKSSRPPWVPRQCPVGHVIPPVERLVGRLVKGSRFSNFHGSTHFGQRKMGKRQSEFTQTNLFGPFLRSASLTNPPCLICEVGGFGPEIVTPDLYNRNGRLLRWLPDATSYRHIILTLCKTLSITGNTLKFEELHPPQSNQPLEHFERDYLALTFPSTGELFVFEAFHGISLKLILHFTRSPWR